MSPSCLYLKSWNLCILLIPQFCGWALHLFAGSAGTPGACSLCFWNRLGCEGWVVTFLPSFYPSLLDSPTLNPSTCVCLSHIVKSVLSGLPRWAVSSTGQVLCSIVFVCSSSRSYWSFIACCLCSSFSLNHPPLALSLVAWWWNIPTESSADLWTPFLSLTPLLRHFSLCLRAVCKQVPETLLSHSGQKAVFADWNPLLALSTPRLPPTPATPLPFALVRPLLLLLQPAGPSTVDVSFPLT